MKNRKYGIILAATLAAAVWATPTFAQDSVRENIRDAMIDRDSVLNPILRPSDRLLARAFNNIDRLPEELQADVIELQESLDLIKDAWVNDYRPGIGATVGEIKEARDAFKEAFADEIDANKELRKEVVRDLRDGLRDRIEDQPWNEEARELYQEYNDLKKQLAAGWRAVLAGLGDDATREDVRAAKARFLEANAEVIAEQKAIAKQIRDLIRENSHNDRPVVDREPLPPELQALRDEIRLARRDLRDRKQDARQELRDLAPEEREAKRLEILDELREAHDDIKDKRRELIEDLRDEQDGDRRAED